MLPLFVLMLVLLLLVLLLMLLLLVLLLLVLLLRVLLLRVLTFCLSLSYQLRHASKSAQRHSLLGSVARAG